MEAVEAIEAIEAVEAKMAPAVDIDRSGIIDGNRVQCSTVELSQESE